MALTQMQGTRIAEWLLLSICPPQKPVEAAGILLLDRKSNQLLFKLKTEFKTGDEVVDLIWDHLPDELNLRIGEAGANEVVDWLETTWSHVFRVSDPHSLKIDSMAEALDTLYREHVAGPTISSR